MSNLNAFLSESLLLWWWLFCLNYKLMFSFFFTSGEIIAILFNNIII